MIVLLINNDQNPISYLIPYSRLNRPCNLNTLVSTAVTTFSGKSVGNEVFTLSSAAGIILAKSLRISCICTSGEFQHLCCRQKMSRINFIDCRFFAFGCVKPHCQFEIADVYSRTAKDRKCRNDVIKWCEPITAASLNKYGEVFAWPSVNGQILLAFPRLFIVARRTE